ncbi:MAG TPA: choice-of-anchor Q domain-containing protein, partial [Verrucomicrobiae bacterium]|nr:choice-of-anchor Q domain-containing protein [Verrucomicrobiae bacterium]
MKCSKATMTIANNSITDNTGNFGAGISCSQSSLLIVSNLIQNNNSISGGVIRSVSSTSTIRNNQIIGNVVQLTLGGSILLTLDRGTDISDNLIFGNSFQGSSGGFDGTGIQVMVSTSCSIRNNTIVWNDSGAQASISLISTTNSVVANNIIGFAYAGISSYQDVTASIHNNCLFANMQNYLRIPDQTGSNGNISMNPQFAVNDSYPEFHLSAASPCRDSGDNSMVLAGDTDVDGGERILGGTVDMGAFEFGNSVTPYVSTIVRVSPAGNDANDGSSWGTAKRTVQSAINQERFSGGEVWVAAGMYLENLTLQTGVHLYGGFSGNETARDQRNAKANLTVLDGNRIAPVISLQYLFGWNTIDGFTIQNGFRGGIYAIGSAPIIANNTITKNSSSYGGIYATWSAGGDALGGRGWILTNNVISSNQATLGAGGYFVGGYPTGLCLFAANNRFEGNVATNGSASRSAGGALYMYLGSAYVANNLFLNNVATNGPGSYTAQGGAICLNQAMMQIFNNTFVGNMAIDNSGSNSGGAVYSMGAAPVVANNLILYGSSGVVGGYFPTDLRNNCVYGNLLNYQGTDLTGTNGNISVDPQLAGPGDYHLSSGSPCINAGLNAYATNDFDFDGNPRISGGTVDIGAYEFQNPASTISYAWLQQYGLPVDGSADTADTDGDRLNNWQEWRAGTSPIDSAS